MPKFEITNEDIIINQGFSAYTSIPGKNKVHSKEVQLFIDD